MEDNTTPLGDVAGGAMVEAGGGDQTGTADQQNQQSSTNGSRATKRRRAYRHSSRAAQTAAEQQRGGAPLGAGHREGEPHQRATSIDDAEKESGPYPPRRSKQQREKRGDLEEGCGRKVDAAG
jgi:hypothetical protein